MIKTKGGEKVIMKKITTVISTGLGWLMALPALAAATKTDYNIGLGNASPEEVVVNIINWVLGILALIAVIMILIGGFKWMTAAGNEEKVESARKLLIAAIIGLVIILAAWGISIYAIDTLMGATNGA